MACRRPRSTTPAWPQSKQPVILHTAPYLYYVAGADGCGELIFSTTYERFLSNAAAYNEAVRKNGGSVPTCRK